MKQDVLKKLLFAVVIIFFALGSRANADLSKVSEVWSDFTTTMGNNARGNMFPKETHSLVNFPIPFDNKGKKEKLTKKNYNKKIETIMFNIIGTIVVDEVGLNDHTEKFFQKIVITNPELIKVIDKNSISYQLSVDYGVGQQITFTFGSIKNNYKIVAIKEVDFFVEFFKEFQQAIKTNNSNKFESFTHFPFILNMSTADYEETKIFNAQEFRSYFSTSDFIELTKINKLKSYRNKDNSMVEFTDFDFEYTPKASNDMSDLFISSSSSNKTEIASQIFRAKKISIMDEGYGSDYIFAFVNGKIKFISQANWSNS